MHVGLGLVRPLGELSGREARRTLAHRLEHQELAARTGKRVVDHVELEIGVLLAHLVGRDARVLVARGERRGEGEVHRRRPLFRALGEVLQVATDRDGRGRCLHAAANLVVEPLRRHRGPDVVGLLDAVENIGKAQDIDIEGRGDLGGEVAAGVDRNTAAVLVPFGRGSAHRQAFLKKGGCPAWTAARLYACSRRILLV